jgi:hypothetical protein
MKPQLIKRSLIENLYKENNKKVFNYVNFQNNVFFNILIIFFLLFCLIFLFYRYSNNKTNYNKNEIDDDDDEYPEKKSTTQNEKYNKKINYQNYPKLIGNKQKFVNNKISDYFTNDNPTNNMLGDIQKYKELSNKYNLE